jgi:methionine synthase II (cobalamin-independent)
MFENVNVDTFYMEYGDDYSGGFQSLQYLPENKNVVLGLIASKFSKMENLEEIKAKVFAAAELVAKAQGNRATKKDALKRMGISPNCGFASHYEDSAIKHQDMVTKLNLVQDLAEEIWSSES